MESATNEPLANEQDKALRPGVFADAVCGVDGTHGSFAAVEQAAALVGGGGSLTLLAVTAVSGAGRYRTAAISPQRVDRVLARAARIAQAAGAHTARVIEPSGPPADFVLRDSAGHDLLAIGAPSASSLGGMLVGGVASAALESFTIPLLTARPRHGHDGFAERIVVASDGSESSEEVIELAQRMSSALGSQIVLVHALGAESQSHPHRIEHQARRLLIAEGAGELRVEAGPPREVILRAATDTRASLILMGSRRRGGLAALSSVSSHVVHEAPCSVLLVPPS
jgi:nucleotide-binding universal stress UspA family protein